MTTQTWARNAVSVTALVWIGMLLGVSFLATPVKFLAPSLTLPAALDVGRQTFGVFSVVEVIGALVLLAASSLLRHSGRIVLLAASIVLLVAGQRFWLLPVLDARVEIILQGGAVQESGLHGFYVAIESVKLVVLGIVCRIAQSAAGDPASHVAADAH